MTGREFRFSRSTDSYFVVAFMRKVGGSCAAGVLRTCNERARTRRVFKKARPHYVLCENKECSVSEGAFVNFRCCSVARGSVTFTPVNIVYVSSSSYVRVAVAYRVFFEEIFCLQEICLILVKRG